MFVFIGVFGEGWTTCPRYCITTWPLYLGLSSDQSFGAQILVSEPFICGTPLFICYNYPFICGNHLFICDTIFLFAFTTFYLRYALFICDNLIFICGNHICESLLLAKMDHPTFPALHSTKNTRSYRPTAIKTSAKLLFNYSSH